MTLDQIFFLLCEMEILSDGRQGRVITVASEQAAVSTDADGWVKGRDEQGNPIRGQILGESLCSRITRQEQAKKEAESKRKKRRR